MKKYEGYWKWISEGDDENKDKRVGLHRETDRQKGSQMDGQTDS